ncbi:ATP-grasp domain-containing protein [Streptomyces sp. NPDC057623]|uniref:ATP-grasp domain-containing protein n=1 Tax=Streptomyces sp. NPDC057623 TaxID=3346187 RepID=UPI00367EE532
MTVSNGWIVFVELHTLPGGGRGRLHSGATVVAPCRAQLEAAKRLGLRTAVAASDRDSYGSQFDDVVDAWLLTDTRDAAGIVHVMKALGGEIVGVFSSVDSFVRVAAAVAAKLGLAGPSPLGAGIARDKAVARAALASAGVPDIRWGVKSAHDDDLDSPIGYPCVVKPVDGASSWDVALAQDVRTVREVAARHLKRDYGRRVRPQRKLLFEEVLVGPLLSAEGFVDGGEVHTIGYSDRVLSAPPRFVELAVRFAADRPFDGVDDYVAETLAALEYDFGAFHLEFILTSDGPRLVELNPRFVGAGVQHAISELTGVTPAELLMAKLTGGEAPEFPREGAVTELYLTAPASGRLEGVRGLDEAVATRGCRAAGLYVAVGDEVSSEVESNSQYIGYVHAVGDSREESYEIALSAASRIAYEIR